MAEKERLERALKAAHEAGDTDAAQRFAQELRQKQAAPRRHPVAEAAVDFQTGMLSLAGPQVRDFLSQYGMTRPTGQDPRTAFGRGMEVAGEATTLAGGGLIGLGQRAGMQAARYLPQFPGAIRSRLAAEQAVPETTIGGRFARETLDTARHRPGAFAAAELGGGFGAGAAMHETDPQYEMLAGLGGGLAGGMAPLTAARAVTNARNLVMENLLPFTESGGMQRAARQMQSRAADPEASAQAALEGPQGVSPARRTQDPELMAQEARVLADSRRMEMDFNEALQRARLASQQEVTDIAGRPRDSEEWAQRVIERVSPGDIRRGDVDDMLTQAYRNFEPLYDQVKGYHGFNRAKMQAGMAQISEDPSVMATDADRDRIARWLDNQMTALGTRPTSDELLTLRSRIRDQARKAARKDDDVGEELLADAEQLVSRELEDGLPPEAAQLLRQTDQQYRTYKIVENAIFRAGDAPLTATHLSGAIRRAQEHPGTYARGGERTLRALVEEGRPIEEVFGRPAAARRMVRDMDEETRSRVQGDFAHALVHKARTPELLTEDGVQAVSGSRLQALVQEHRATGKALGLTDDQMRRLDQIAKELRTMEVKSPRAVEQLFEDGPANVLQLGAALVGAKTGQRTAGRGLGSSLVLAQFFSKKMRDALSRLTSDKATELMIQAHQDPQLYAALLTRPTSSTKRQDEAAQILNAWLFPAVSAEAMRRPTGVEEDGE